MPEPVRASAARTGEVVNALTIDVEDYFQVSAFAPYIARSTWEEQPCRVEQNIDRFSCADRDASGLGVEHLRVGRGEQFALHAEVFVRRAGLADRHALGCRAGKQRRLGIEDVWCHESNSAAQARAEVGQQPDAAGE